MGTPVRTGGFDDCRLLEVRQRLDHAHNTALTLVREYDVIVHEDGQ